MQNATNNADQTAKNAAISARILAKIAAGEPLAAAFDAVLGAGQYAKLVDDLYHELRAKAGN
jgi:hypothetical protein